MHFKELLGNTLFLNILLSHVCYIGSGWHVSKEEPTEKMFNLKSLNTWICFGEGSHTDLPKIWKKTHTYGCRISWYFDQTFTSGERHLNCRLCSFSSLWKHLFASDLDVHMCLFLSLWKHLFVSDLDVYMCLFPSLWKHLFVSDLDRGQALFLLMPVIQHSIKFTLFPVIRQP